MINIAEKKKVMLQAIDALKICVEKGENKVHIKNDLGKVIAFAIVERDVSINKGIR